MFLPQGKRRKRSREKKKTKGHVAVGNSKYEYHYFFKRQTAGGTTSESHKEKKGVSGPGERESKTCTDSPNSIFEEKKKKLMIVNLGRGRQERVLCYGGKMNPMCQYLTPYFSGYKRSFKRGYRIDLTPIVAEELRRKNKNPGVTGVGELISR